MIFGNHALFHIDGAEYIRIAQLGHLHAIAEEMGMDKKNSHILADAIDEFEQRLRTEMYKEVKSLIP